MEVRSGWPAAILILQPVLFFWKTLISKTTNIPWDLPGFHTPLASVVVEALRQGRFPLWEPYTYAGYPLHADLQAQLFYPPAWLAFLLGAFVREDAIFYWLEWLVAFHLMLAGAGAYFLLRRLGCGRGAALFGATAFQLGCFFSSQTQHLGAISGAAWMPFAWLGMWLLAEGFTPRRFALLAVALAMSLLSGFPAVTLVVCGTTALLALVLAIRDRNRALPVLAVAGFVLAAALSAVQLAPTLQYSPESAASLRWKWNQPEGVTPRALIGLFWPNWLSVFTPFDPSKFKETANFTFLYFYNGQAAAWLALAALFVRRGRLFAVLAAASALVLCGGHLPGYAVLFRSLPKMVRNVAYVEFTLAAFSLAIAVAAALVLERLTRGRERWAAVIALATGVELLLVASNRPMNAMDGNWKRNDSTRQMMQSAGLLSAVRSLVHETVPPMRTDTAANNPRFTSSAPLLRLPSANGDNALAPLRMLAYRALYTKVVPWERQYPIENLASPWIGAANVGFLVGEGAPLDENRLAAAGWIRVPLDAGQPLAIYRNRQVLPRYRLVGALRPARDREEARRLLPALEPASVAVAEAPITLPQNAGEAPGHVEVLRYVPETVELQVHAARPAWLVAAEGYAPGWKASIDGVPASVYPTNLAFLGLPVPEGSHRLILRYSPEALSWWAAVSAISWIALGLWVFPRSLS